MNPYDRKLTRREILEAYLIRLLGHLLFLWDRLKRLLGIGLCVAGIWIVSAAPVAADGPHHVCPAWCQSVLKGAPGWTYIPAGHRKVYAWGPVKGLQNHVVIMDTAGHFTTQFIPSDGFNYVIRRAYEDIRAVGASHADALRATKGGSLSWAKAFKFKVIVKLSRAAALAALKKTVKAIGIPGPDDLLGLLPCFIFQQQFPDLVRCGSWVAGDVKS